ncbi:hypothetical protein B2G71_19310 [Novosphingobium sp. PC22D]|uniref:GumC family protein n=1 Tax=Novosphingobium sp. PC22D TaxID=1962403 RepID=UPI000BFAF59E|nr:polysaccharide biosynthesis tyrosine autokinase [Novosphingobium sp. PC22D]PEQ10968.1 hypothetical protein B2G71_19310 [Novosphingobium sp. PC22D]
MNQIMSDTNSAPSGNQSSWMDRYLPANANGADTDPLGGDHSLINIATIRGFFWRQRFILSGVLATVLVIGFIATMLISPSYKATATVRIDPAHESIIEGQELSNQIVGRPVDYMGTLAAVVKSRTIALKVAQQLNLANNYAFLDIKSGDDLAAQTKTAAQSRENRAAAILQAHVDTQNSVGNIMEISYMAGDPVIAAKIANRYVDALLKNDVQVSLQKNTYALDYLSKKIEEVRQNLSTSERNSISYARSAKIVSQSLLGGTNDQSSGAAAAPQTVVAANLASVNSTYTDARAKRIEAEQRWNSVKSIPAAMLPEVQANGTIQGLIGDRSRKLANLAELKSRYGQSYPQVRELTSEIATLTSQIDKLSNDIKAGIRQEYQIAQSQEQALGNELNNVSNATLDEQDRRVQFNQLDRKAKSLATQLDSLLDRYNQIAAAANIQPGTISLLDPATTPSRPASPNLAKNLVLALVLGVGLAVALAVAADVLDDRLHSVDEIQRKLAIKSLGVTPMIRNYSPATYNKSLSEAYSSVRVMLDFILPRPRHNIIMFTSSQPAEGKTTTAVAIAKQYAGLGQRVLLVDGDLRRPSIPYHFDAPRSKVGIVDVLLGQLPLNQALINQKQANLDVLPIGTIPNNPVDIFSSQRMVEFLAEVRDVYDLVIIDSAPVMGLADAVLLARLTDGVVFILDAEQAHLGSAKAAIRRLRQANANMLGTVLTKFNARVAGEGYYYSDYYSYGTEDEKA